MKYKHAYINNLIGKIWSNVKAPNPEVSFVGGRHIENRKSPTK
jgi:hypothetical protein